MWDFKAHYEQTTEQQLLVLTKKNFNREDIIEYQVEMIAKNILPGIIGLEVRERDAEVKLAYQITGLVTLVEYLHNQTITATELLALMERVVVVLQECKNYFLSETAFCLNANYLYVNPESAEVALIYLPVELKQDLVSNLKVFFVNLVTNLANLEQAGDFVPQVLQLVKTEGFNLLEFRQQLKKLKIAYCNQAEGFDTELKLLPTSSGPVQEYITVVPPQQKKPVTSYDRKPQVFNGFFTMLVISLVTVLFSVIYFFLN